MRLRQSGTTQDVYLLEGGLAADSEAVLEVLILHAALQTSSAHLWAPSLHNAPFHQEHMADVSSF